MKETKTIELKFLDEKKNVVIFSFSLENQKKIINKLWKENLLWDVVESVVGKNWFKSIVDSLYEDDGGRKLAEKLYNALGNKRFGCLIENCKETLDKKPYHIFQPIKKRNENSERDKEQREKENGRVENSQEFLKLFQKMCENASTKVKEYENDLIEIDQTNIGYRRICLIKNDYQEKISPQYELFRIVVPQLTNVAAFRKNNSNPPLFGDVENALEDVSIHYKSYCQNSLPIGRIENYFNEKEYVSSEVNDKIREYKKLFSVYDEILSKIQEKGMTDEIVSKFMTLSNKQEQMDNELKHQQENPVIQKNQIIYQQEYPFYYDRRAYWDYAELLEMLEPVLKRITAQGRWREDEVYEVADSIYKVIDGANTLQGSFFLLDCNGDEAFDLNFDYSTYNQPALFYKEKDTERLQCLTRGKTLQDWR